MTATGVISYLHKINHIEFPGEHPPYRSVLIELTESVDGSSIPLEMETLDIHPLLEE